MAGIYVAPVTPFHGDLSINYSALSRQIERLVEGGVHGITAAAITAETESLTFEEHRRVLKACVDAAAGAVPVFVGVGRPSMEEMERLLDYADEIDADGVFLLTPYASGYTLAETVAYIEHAASRTSLPVMLYNAPNYTGVNMTPAVNKELSKIPNVMGIKEGNQPQLGQTLMAVEGRMEVLTGRDSHLVESMAIGGHGVVSFAGNVCPKHMVAIYEAALEGDFARARRLHEKLVPLVEVLVRRSYPLMIKEAMNRLGLEAGPARRTAVPLSAEEEAALERVTAYDWQ